MSTVWTWEVVGSQTTTPVVVLDEESALQQFPMLGWMNELERGGAVWDVVFVVLRASTVRDSGRERENEREV